VRQVACYTEIKRVLKPGQLFAGYEWCMTESYNPKDEAHQKCKVWIRTSLFCVHGQIS
jgi:sterol 24-C-methyltransferase